MRPKHVLIALLFCLAAASLLQSQSAPAPNDEIKFATQPYIPQDTNAIRVKATMVDINVVVRDSHGQAISGLTRDDFEVYDQGKKQKITLFTPELAHPPVVYAPAPKTTAAVPEVPPLNAPAAPPRYLGFYFDDINMTMSQLVYVRKAAETFVRNTMDETDRIAVFTSSVTVTQQFTSNKQELLDVIGKVLSQKHITASGCPIMTPYEAYEIGLFDREKNDALTLAVGENGGHQCCAGDCVNYVLNSAEAERFQNEMIALDTLGVLGDVIRYVEKMPGRRSLIVASGGYYSMPQQIQHTQDKMIASAIHAGIIINTLGAKGLTADYDFSQPREIFNRASGSAYGSLLNTMEKEVSDDGLSAVAQGTGGKFFHDNNDMIAGLRELAELPAASYVLAFSPDELKDNGLFHNLKVKVPVRRDVKIAARPGYFALTREQAAPAAKLQRLDAEVMKSDTLTELTADVATQSARLGSGESGLKIAVHVPGKSLSFKKRDKLHAERLIFITALFDMQNHYLAGTEALMDLSLKNDTFARISHDGVDAKATLQLPPGHYRLRQVVQEVVGGRIATISREVEIRDVSANPPRPPVSNALE
jgi:VWFA-related protein